MVFAPIRPKQLPILKRGLGRRRSIPPVPQGGNNGPQRGATKGACTMPIAIVGLHTCIVEDQWPNPN